MEVLFMAGKVFLLTKAIFFLKFSAVIRVTEAWAQSGYLLKKQSSPIRARDGHPGYRLCADFAEFGAT